MEQLTNNTKIRSMGGQTPIQISLPNGLYSPESDILLLVRDTDAYHIRKGVGESSYLSHALTQIATISEFQEFNKNKLKAKLNEFDLILID